MNQRNTLPSMPHEHLSVIRPDPSLSFDHAAGIDPVSAQDLVIQADLDFNITGWNLAAEFHYGLHMQTGRNLFDTGWLGIPESRTAEIRATVQREKKWSGEFTYRPSPERRKDYYSMINYLVDGDGAPTAFVMVNRDITEIKQRERQMLETEKEYATIVNTLFDGVLMIRADGQITAANRRAAEILGIPEEELRGKRVFNPTWKTVRQDGTEFPVSEFPAIVSLQTGFPQRNVVLGLDHPNGNRIWLLINSQALFKADEKHPYAVVASFSDITEKINGEEALRKSHERFIYAGKVTSEGIWDLDLETNEIYRSEAFAGFSGYSIDEIRPNLDWWFDKVHPEDRERVRQKVQATIKKGIARWQDEYRFQCADGSYKYLLDSGIILYKKGKPVRVIGAIQDLTERKELEARLLKQEIQKQKQVNQATISAQEQERNNISRELHDNVNQILMSAKLFMDTALKDPEQSSHLLDKAKEYQLLALEEIRKLSKSLNSSLIRTVGLRECISDIVINMQQLQQLHVTFHFNDALELKLSNDQKIMIYRIIQEQTNNIIKYASARSVQILINESRGQVSVIVSDDGKGFDPSKKSGGIGLTNICNRADAYNGRVNIISSLGNGCILEVQFPLS